MSLPRYPEYKDSKDSLFGSVPSHWFRSALKRAAVYKNGYAFKPEDWEDQGTPIIRIAQLTGEAEPNCYAGELDESYRVENGDLLFSWSATIDSFIWNSGTAWLNQHIFKVSPTEEAITSYLFYLIKFVAPKLAELDAHGSTMRHIKKESLGQLVYLPTLAEQTAIATFLDRETAKIDALIAEQEKLLTLLAEKRQATISHAVTKGLNPDVPMKDSGMDWLGEVPAHWVATRLGHLVRQIVDGAHFTPTYVDEGVPFLRVTDITSPTLDLSEVKRIPEAEHIELSRRCCPKKGDLLLSKNGTIGVPRVISWDWEFSIFVSLCLIKLGPKLSVHFAAYVFQSSTIQIQIEDGKKQSTVTNLHLEKIAGFKFPVPPLEEQLDIVRYLDNETTRLNALTTEATLAIDLLKERRTALISAAVTGKIDVRHLANQEAA